MTERAREALTYLRERGWMGEAGLGLLVCAAVGVPLHLSGATGAVWGVPLSLVWAGGAGGGAFLLTASLRLIPSRDS